MFTFRWANAADIPAIAVLMDRAISVLQKGFLSPAEIAASRSVMGLDTQLIADGTYLLAEQDGRLAGCGGWSARATLYGGDHSQALRDAAMLDPAPRASGRCMSTRISPGRGWAAPSSPGARRRRGRRASPLPR
ncbi:MAG: hypothetical protein ACTMKV_11530 [Sphingomonas parapaucimobilis]